jgi:hypothetical protein
VDVEKLVSEEGPVNNVGSLTFPTVSAGIMSTAREILESLRERKEIQMFDWNQKILQKTAVFLSPPDYPAWVRSQWGGSWASSSCKCLVAEKLPDTETCKFIFLLSSTNNNGMSCLRLAEDRMQLFGIR